MAAGRAGQEGSSLARPRGVARGVGGGTAGQGAAGVLAVVGVEGSAANPEGRLRVGDRELSPRHDGPASRRRARRRRSVGRWR